MPPALLLCLLASAAYLAGSVPFGLLMARLVKGVDIRRHGSGNIGATNVTRLLGKKWGAGVLLLDALKGLLPTLLLPLATSPEHRPAAAVACGVAAILGHVFPVWLGFRGGKGVATGAGVAAVLCPWAALAALVAFGVAFAVKRIVAVASILAALTYAAVSLWQIGLPPDRRDWPLAAFAVGIPTLIVLRHRDNLRRLLAGEEHAFAKPRAEETAEKR